MPGPEPERCRRGRVVLEVVPGVVCRRRFAVVPSIREHAGSDTRRRSPLVAGYLPSNDGCAEGSGRDRQQLDPGSASADPARNTTARRFPKGNLQVCARRICHFPTTRSCVERGLPKTPGRRGRLIVRGLGGAGRSWRVDGARSLKAVEPGRDGIDSRSGVITAVKSLDVIGEQPIRACRVHSAGGAAGAQSAPRPAGTGPMPACRRPRWPHRKGRCLLGRG